MKLIGFIEALCEPVVGSTANGEWIKQTFVLREGNTHRIAIDAWGAKKVERIRAIPLESRVEVDFEILAREYKGRWYNDVTMQDIVFVRTEAVPTLAERTAMTASGGNQTETAAPTVAMPNEEQVQF